MRLIFIEGVSGVGKTTMTQKLCALLRSREYTVKAFEEFDYTNPIDFYCTAYLSQYEHSRFLGDFPMQSAVLKENTLTVGAVRLVRYYNREVSLFTEPLLGKLRRREFCTNPPKQRLVTLAEYHHVYKKIWTDFVQSEGERPDFMIFDGSLLHHPINDMMRNYDAPMEAILAHVNTMLEIVSDFDPLVVYLSDENVEERLVKARNERNQPPASPKSIEFWQKRRVNDLAVLAQLNLPYDVHDISRENWDELLTRVSVHVCEDGAARRARIYPIVLEAYNPEWVAWYGEEKEYLVQKIGGENITNINHYGSTAVPGLTAKPTVDILLELNEGYDLKQLPGLLSDYVFQWRDMADDPLVLYKGYAPAGFGERIFHVHVRHTGDWDELYFRDYLITNPEVASEYAALKIQLAGTFPNDRDAYTDAKGAFIKEVTDKARATSPLAALTQFIFVENAITPGDIILVPGGSHPQLAQKAAELYHQGVAPYILFSGKENPALPEFPSEATWLKSVAMENGVPEESILCEENAAHTFENAQFSLDIITQRGLPAKKIILVCKAYHSRRALLTYQYVFPRGTVFLTAPVTDKRGLNRGNWTSEPAYISRVMDEVQKIGEYFADKVEGLR